VADAPETIGDATTDWIDRMHAVIDVEGGMPNGYRDSLLVTADGGQTWAEPAMQVGEAGVDGITGFPGFLDLSVGWLAGGAPGTRLWATRDGGATWRLQRLAVPAGYIDDQGSFWVAPRFFDRTNGVVARTFANNQDIALVIYRTSDSGVTWTPMPAMTPDANSWSFPSERSWILWRLPSMWRSTDQGATWSRLPTTGLPGDAAPVMTDDLHGWALGSAPSSLYVTGDGGQKWTNVQLTFTKR
jgi:photosystem II stability/assembly factor-like uncharacterized protein